MNRHMSDLGTIDVSLLTDAPYNNYVEKINITMGLFQNAIMQVLKNEETEKILNADGFRDKTISTFGLAIKLHSSSDDAEVVEASRSLKILFDTYKNIAKLNYEAETLAIDKLVDELNKESYAVKITFLHMSKYVTRMAEANEVFRNLFANRMVTTAMTESYDMKTIRKELKETYTDFAEYVLAMAKATEIQLFATALNLLNAARKYYTDQIISRTIKPKAETPVV